MLLSTGGENKLTNPERMMASVIDATRYLIPKFEEDLKVPHVTLCTNGHIALETGSCLGIDRVKSILHLPYDQRYGVEEMKYIASTILKIVSQET